MHYVIHNAHAQNILPDVNWTKTNNTTWGNPHVQSEDAHDYK